MKKALAKNKGKTSKPAKKKRSPKSTKPVDLAEVRKQISDIVGGEAAALALAVVEEARKGQLAPVKYLFEAIGLYPAPEGSQPRPEDASLAKTLLHRLGLPEDLAVRREEEVPLKLAPASNSGKEAEEALGNSDPQPKSQNNLGEKDADEDDDVPVLAESIP
jgi:hypothetical protein